MWSVNRLKKEALVAEQNRADFSATNLHNKTMQPPYPHDSGKKGVQQQTAGLGSQDGQLSHYSRDFTLLTVLARLGMFSKSSISPSLSLDGSIKSARGVPRFKAKKTEE